MVTLCAVEQVTPERRSQLLDSVITRETMAGAVLASRSGYQAVLDIGTRAGVNHVLHAVLTLLTCSLWLWVWLVLILTDSSRASAASRRYTVMVDEWGRGWSRSNSDTEWKPLAAI